MERQIPNPNLDTIALLVVVTVLGVFIESTQNIYLYTTGLRGSSALNYMSHLHPSLD